VLDDGGWWSMMPRMLVVHVHVHVKPEAIAAFIAASRVNSDESLKEPGVARFDLIQELDDPGHFVLVEAYKTAEASAAHKATAHYAAWRDAVADMMASPRSSVKFESLCPEEKRWSTPPA
jgi:(4S)-4-hydroxy-5-phosphonooxypentane-2,3-dione isomerase